MRAGPSYLLAAALVLALGGPAPGHAADDLDLPDATAPVGKVFSLPLGSHPVYGDPRVKVKISVAPGSPLPSWLIFSQTDRLLAGLPLMADRATLLIVVTATCLNAGDLRTKDCRERTDVFQLTVTGTSIPVHLGGSQTEAPRLTWPSDPSAGADGADSLCDGEKVLASLVLCASLDDLDPAQRLTIARRLSSFMSVPLSSVTVEPTSTQYLVAVQRGFQMVFAGPGSETACGLSQNVEALWSLSCPSVRHLRDFAQVLQHNVDGGRLQAELGLPLVGWYVASSSSARTRQGRRRRGVGHNTPMPTPSPAPVSPTSVTQAMTSGYVVISSSAEVVVSAASEWSHIEATKTVPQSSAAVPPMTIPQMVDPSSHDLHSATVPRPTSSSYLTSSFGRDRPHLVSSIAAPLAHVEDGGQFSVVKTPSLPSVSPADQQYSSSSTAVQASGPHSSAASSRSAPRYSDPLSSSQPSASLIQIRTVEILPPSHDWPSQAPSDDVMDDLTPVTTAVLVDQLEMVPGARDETTETPGGQVSSSPVSDTEDIVRTIAEPRDQTSEFEPVSGTSQATVTDTTGDSLAVDSGAQVIQQNTTQKQLTQAVDSGASLVSGVTRLGGGHVVQDQTTSQGIPQHTTPAPDRVDWTGHDVVTPTAATSLDVSTAAPEQLTLTNDTPTLTYDPSTSVQDVTLDLTEPVGDSTALVGNMTSHTGDHVTRDTTTTLQNTTLPTVIQPEQDTTLPTVDHIQLGQDTTAAVDDIMASSRNITTRTEIDITQDKNATIDLQDSDLDFDQTTTLDIRVPAMMYGQNTTVHTDDPRHSLHRDTTLHVGDSMTDDSNTTPVVLDSSKRDRNTTLHVGDSMTDDSNTTPVVLDSSKRDRNTTLHVGDSMTDDSNTTPVVLDSSKRDRNTTLHVGDSMTDDSNTTPVVLDSSKRDRNTTLHVGDSMTDDSNTTPVVLDSSKRDRNTTLHVGDSMTDDSNTTPVVLDSSKRDRNTTLHVGDSMTDDSNTTPVVLDSSKRDRNTTLHVGDSMTDDSNTTPVVLDSSKRDRNTTLQIRDSVPLDQNTSFHLLDSSAQDQNVTLEIGDQRTLDTDVTHHLVTADQSATLVIQQNSTQEQMTSVPSATQERLTSVPPPTQEQLTFVLPATQEQLTSVPPATQEQLTSVPPAVWDRNSTSPVPHVVTDDHTLVNTTQLPSPPRDLLDHVTNGTTKRQTVLMTEDDQTDAARATTLQMTSEQDTTRPTAVVDATPGQLTTGHNTTRQATVVTSAPGQMTTLHVTDSQTSAVSTRKAIVESDPTDQVTTATKSTSRRHKKTTTTPSTSTAQSTVPSTSILYEGYSGANNRPFVKEPIKRVTGLAGQVLDYHISPDVFTDVEDGDTRSLRLSLELQSGAELPTSYWLYLDADLQVLRGLPLKEDLILDNSSVYMVATDSGGLTERMPISLQIIDPLRKNFTHSFVMKFNVDFRKFMEHRRNITRLVNKIGSYFGDSGTEYITVLGVRQGSFILSWTNHTLAGPDCPREIIDGLYYKMDTKMNDLRAHLGTNLKLDKVTKEDLGACSLTTARVATTTTTATHFVSNTVAHGFSIWAHVVLPVVIAFLVFILIILIIIFCNRRRRHRQAIINAEKEAISNDRNPIIFPDEIDTDDAVLQAKDPLVLPTDQQTSGQNSPESPSQSCDFTQDVARSRHSRDCGDQEWVAAENHKKSEKVCKQSKDSSGGRKHSRDGGGRKQKDRMSGVSASSSLSFDRPNNHYLDEEEANSRNNTLTSNKSTSSDKRHAKQPPPYWQSQTDPPPYRLPPPYLNNTTQV